jgi:hypothetical protein
MPITNLIERWPKENFPIRKNTGKVFSLTAMKQQKKLMRKDFSFQEL